MAGETFKAMGKRPFQRREFVDQAWFVARVSMVPTVLVAIPFTVLVVFTINVLLRENVMRLTAGDKLLNEVSRTECY